MLATIVPLLLAVVLVVGVAGGASLLAPALRVGDRAPDFALADLDGEPVRLADYVGRPVLVNFWASWCLPACADEFPVLAEALQANADIGLAVIGIVYRDRSEAARAFGNQFGATWPLAMDPGERVARAYGVFGPPESWLVGPDGIVVSRHIGPFTAEELAEELVHLASDH
ncbi:MAG TPA: TlpA disulfide reductase family protein [Pleomorphomonadaceae bacterium]|nr:TlpA disulfide reductase family protein [Pleomorphomonadaceae bacterium]